MLALLLAAMMSVSVLAGCNQNEQSETQQSTEETTEQTTEQASEENTDAESTESESTSGEEASTQNTEKITLSDESGLPQFNNPAEDSEVANPHHSWRYQRNVLPGICTKSSGKLPDTCKGRLL